MHMTLDTRSLSRIAVAVACICLGAVAARAQEPSPTALAVARDVVITKGATEVADPLVHGVIESVKNSFVPTNPSLTRELNEVATALHKEYDGKRSEVIDGYRDPARLLASGASSARDVSVADGDISLVGFDCR